MPKILVVDDALPDRALSIGLLKKAIDCSIVEAIDGQDALAKIEADLPDLVLTDLQMPNMNGLELVSAVKDDFPLVPVILITAKGSEEIAAEALRAGAASYVPKRNLANTLVPTVKRVLKSAHENRGQTHLMHFLEQTDSTFTLYNDLAIARTVVSYVSNLLRCLPLADETERVRVGIALEEALNNAYYHGNLEIGSGVDLADRDKYDQLAAQRLAELPYRDRRIRVKIQISREQAMLVVKDDGPGFDVSALSNTEPSINGDHRSGRGLVLIHSIMDQVKFNDAGNEITMIKNRFEDEPELVD